MDAWQVKKSIASKEEPLGVGDNNVVDTLNH
jgi:hypothetical protein